MVPRLQVLSTLALLSASLSMTAFADVVTFTNGAAISGTFLGGDARTVRIEVNGQVQTYRISEVAHIQFGDVAIAGAGTGAVAAAQQTAGAFGVQAPTIAAPAVQAPALAAPAVQAPAIAAPQVQAPALAAPQVQAPPLQAPAVQAPAMQAPAVAAPQVQAPAVQAPAPKKGGGGFLGLGRKKKEEEAPPPQQAAALAPAAAPVAAAPVAPAPVAVAPPPAPAPVAVVPAPAPQPVAVAAQPATVGAPAAAPAVAAQPAAAPPAVAPAPPQPVAISAPPAPAMQQVPLGGKDGRTIPEGALLQVRMIDTIDTAVHKPGEVFRASLENELAAAGDILIAKGTDVNVRLVQVPNSGSARPRYRLEAVSIRLGSRNLPIAAEALPFVDLNSLGTPWKDGLAKIALENDKAVTFRFTREFRVP